MSEQQLATPASAARRDRDNPWTRSLAGVLGLAFLSAMLLLSIGSLPWTLGTVDDAGSTPRYNAGEAREGRLPPSWAPVGPERAVSLNRAVEPQIIASIAAEAGVTPEDAVLITEGPVADSLRSHWPGTLLGSDELGRSLFVRCLLGGSISLGIGIAAALLSVSIGTIYGVVAGYVGGTLDSVMMRIVDIIYGLPYILLVVLLAVAGDALIEEWISQGGNKSAMVLREARAELEARGEPASAAAARQLLEREPELAANLRAAAGQAFPPRRISPAQRNALDLAILLIAIGGVSWLTMARVIRGQVLSLKNQPFMEAARAIGVPLPLQFIRHLLPNMIGPIVVYTTLTVPQAILQESFLSFLGIGVKPPLPSWGNLAADGLDQVNRHRSDWWLLLFPSLLLGATLLALNFVGEGLREAFDPKRARQ
ncbi:MAG: ABC transporter permease [Planctomycetota bacterium]